MKSSNYLILLFVSIALVFSSCSTEQKENTSLLSIVQNGDSNLGRDSLRTLKEEVRLFVEDDQNGADSKVELMYEYGLLLDRNRSFSESTRVFKDIVIDYGDSEWSEKALYVLMNTYKVKVKSPQAAEFLSAVLLAKNPDHPKKDELNGNIGDSFKGISEGLASIESKALYEEEGEVKVDRVTANQFVFLSQVNASLRPQDEKSRHYLDRASEFARSIVNNEELLDIFNLLIRLYPDSKEGQQALFLKAFHLENVVKDKESARSLYQEF